MRADTDRTSGRFASLVGLLEHWARERPGDRAYVFLSDQFRQAMEKLAGLWPLLHSMRGAANVRENTSRPDASVPNRCAELGPTSIARLRALRASGCCAAARCSRAWMARATAGTRERYEPVWSGRNGI